MKKHQLSLFLILELRVQELFLFPRKGKYWQKPRRAIIRLMFQENPDGQNRILILLPESVPCFQTASGELSGYFCSDPGSNAYNDPLYQCLPWTGRRTFAPCNFMAGSEKSFRYACAEALDFCSGKSSGNDKTLNLQYQKSHCNWIRENEPDIWAKQRNMFF